MYHDDTNRNWIRMHARYVIMTDQCHSFLVKSSWICTIPDVPVFQTTVAHGSKKETTTPLSTGSKFMNWFTESRWEFTMLKGYGFHEKPSKHLTVFSPETVNIKKLANLTVNTKNYRKITLNTKPHSDPLIGNTFKLYPTNSFHKNVEIH